MLLRLTTIAVAFFLWVPVAQAWTWPVKGPVLQAFSYDEAHPYAAGQHRGIDIGASAAGGSVVAPASGTISFAGRVPTNGNSVTIETPDGYSVTLTHLGSIAVADGASVVEGAPVGTVGPSGTPEEAGPYVHLGIRHTADVNSYLDPLSLLPPLTSPPSDPTGSSGSVGAGGSSSAGSGASAGTGSGGVHVPAKPASSGGGIVIRSRPAAAAATAASTSRSTSASASVSTSASASVRPGRGARTGNAENSGHRAGHRPELRQPSRQRGRTRTPQQPVVETTPILLRHAARPPLAGAARPSIFRPRPAQQPLQLGLAAGPGILATLAVLVTVLVRLRRRRHRAGPTAVVRHLRPPKEATIQRAA